jgi:hypothetical protein
MNTFYIDPTGGIAGDMFAASLISAGADETLMCKAMWLAASKLGKAEVHATKTDDGATRLIINVQHNQGNLSGHAAGHILNSVFEELALDIKYREFGMKALNILIEAEKEAHRTHSFLTDSHHHSHHDHSHDDHHHHHHSHEHSHPHHDDAYLHEAQDILIDITGAAYGLQLLDAPVQAQLLAPVSLGGGVIRFSHGEMPVPAPATKLILQSKWIPAQMGPLDTELCTPTGACILAALEATHVNSKAALDGCSTGHSRGGKDLLIPPLKVFLPLING